MGTSETTAYCLMNASVVTTVLFVESCPNTKSLLFLVGATLFKKGSSLRHIKSDLDEIWQEFSSSRLNTEWQIFVMSSYI